MKRGVFATSNCGIHYEPKHFFRGRKRLGSLIPVTVLLWTHSATFTSFDDVAREKAMT